MKSKIHQDVWVGCFILLVCGLFFSMSLGKGGDAMTFPIILLSLMAVLSIPIIISGLKKTKTTTAAKPVDNDLQLNKLKVPITTFLFIAGYVFLFWLIGYFVATFLFLPALMLQFRLRKPLIISLITLGYVIILYALFVRQLKVPVFHFGYLEQLIRG